MSARSPLLALPTSLGLVLTLAQAVPGQAPAQAEPAATWERHELVVPLDHDRQAEGSLRLTYELAEPFDPRRPTLLWVADGQQFQLRREGATVRLRDERLGLPAGAINLVGLVGRGFDDEVSGRLRDGDGRVDWVLAYRLLGSRQWVGDLEALRRELVGAEGKLLLYGASGGGYLVHEYLARHGEHVARALTEVAPVRPLDGWLGLFDDRFWRELQGGDAGRAERLAGALAANPRRDDLVRLLQRQHYFVGAGELAGERLAAVDEILRGDHEAIARRLEAYQVGAMRELEASDAGIGIAVRMYEFAEPVLRHVDLGGGAVHPNLENEAGWAAPLLELARRGAIPPVALDRRALHRLPAQVLVIGGRWDQTADYRAQIALAALYPQGELFLADDGHTLGRLEASGGRRRLLATFLLHGLGSPQLEALLVELEPLRWRESGGG